jgi:hypothetical protein
LEGGAIGTPSRSEGERTTPPPTPSPLTGLLGATADRRESWTRFNNPDGPQAEFDRQQGLRRRVESERDAFQNHLSALSEAEQRAGQGLKDGIAQGNIRPSVYRRTPVSIVVTSNGRAGQPIETFDPTEDTVGLHGVQYHPQLGGGTLALSKQGDSYPTIYVKGVSRDVLDQIVGPQTAQVLTKEVTEEALTSDIARDVEDSWDRYQAVRARREQIKTMVDSLVEMRQLRLERLRTGERSIVDDLWAKISGGRTDRAWNERSRPVTEQALELGL